MARLVASSTTTEGTYYPATRQLLTRILRDRRLPFDVRTVTNEIRDGGSNRGTDQPDFALYDGAGEFLVVPGEIKRPDADLQELAESTERNDQIGRYLALTGVVILSNVRSFALVTRDPGWSGPGAVPATARRLERQVEFWPSTAAARRNAPVPESAYDEVADLVEIAVTRYAPIAEPESLARILAREARAAKDDLPEHFSRAVTALREDFGAALGITFEDEEGEEFFRSSLVQTAFYALFAAWVLWHYERRTATFRWEDIGEYLRIRFLAQLFHEFKHPARIDELRLARHLDVATETLRRVDTNRFFAKFPLPDAGRDDDWATLPIVYFYEPFLEAFDPELRKDLGVWYTPPEIVRYQVRKTDEILRKELGCPRGFADERVVVLDPCCGTGAYLLEVMRSIVEQLRSEGEDALVAARATDAFLNRVVGFEILTAPFVIAQLQIYLSLSRLGAQLDPATRPAVFLTNALTGWINPEQVTLSFPELQEEHDAAQRVKTNDRIIVILGNPPYNRFAGVPLKEESDLVDYYKGIRRDAEGRQVGQTRLYTEWRVKKHLLDDLYIRFFRLAERSIGERAPFGVVSFISNSSYLAGRSHPIMRESLLRNFDHVWIDNLHGNRLASERTPWGDSCETIFNTQGVGGGPGIRVGTAVITLCKKQDHHSEDANVLSRDFWGGATEKRAALLQSLDLAKWDEVTRDQASKRPEGPREYVEFTPTKARRWRLLPSDTASPGYEDWLSLDELFPTSWQGVNPNRGLTGSLIDVKRDDLTIRMFRYFDPGTSFEDLERDYPKLCKKRARYDPKATRDALLQTSALDEGHIQPYLLFPLDSRYIYYEPEAKLLNERRQEIWDSLPNNEFLLTVPQARRPSEMLPILSTTLYDLHVHDRGTTGFPAEQKVARISQQRGSHSRAANLNESLRRHLTNIAPRQYRTDEKLVRALFRIVLAVVYAPDYLEENRDHVTYDFARIPIPRDPEVFSSLVETGDRIARLLNPDCGVDSLLHEILADRRAALGNLSSTAGTALSMDDLKVTYSYFASAPGKYRERPAPEGWPTAWGGKTGDLYINPGAFFANVPDAVWRYELGGYPVLKKWLGYRKASDREGMPLSLDEVSRFRSSVQRLAALLLLGETLNAGYHRAAECALRGEELGL